ncbi:hypothetical protein Metho_2573 (plasmid) [Methanomethylovorans hollandica DSM 15978]|uniref:Uncharacterized protein n=1 Tax=Methanomethylovorans hollandica (strain DSM 15978 / NBRC 107637 / DMS1) TaxID=867904 RepID=L0KZ29_METHD|nr:hypothetical protein [Methanomethylovorans hollandica]AGB50712.1 hypothetical protein Metho_2573 [Methanomethylovorans hollandica DSM 15978]
MPNIVTNGIEQLITNNHALNEDSLKIIQEYLPYEAVIHMIELDRSRFLKDITDSSMYWKMERSAKKMGSPYKCNQCQYFANFNLATSQLLPISLYAA